MKKLIVYLTIVGLGALYWWWLMTIPLDSPLMPKIATLSALALVWGAVMGLVIGEDIGLERGRAKPPTTEVAFKTLKEALQKDPDYAWSWHCNIAMAIYDESRRCICPAGIQFHGMECPANNGPLYHAFCNAAAARFMKLCFDVDTSQPPEPDRTQRTESGHEYLRGELHDCGVSDCPANTRSLNA